MRRKYYRCDEEIVQYNFTIKHEACPWCRSVGFLILHGFLRGYAEDTPKQIRRGRRYYCSNRNRRGGCGRTFCVYFAHILRNKTMQAKSLWSFLSGIGNGLSKKRALEKARLAFSQSSAYRLWKEFCVNQSWIRTILSTHSPPPRMSHTADSTAQVLCHLHVIFPQQCPIAQFQQTFQKPFLR